jgi:hypothetical protein
MTHFNYLGCNVTCNYGEGINFKTCVELYHKHQKESLELKNAEFLQNYGGAGIMEWQ